jgi:hypothetical protein
MTYTTVALIFTVLCATGTATAQRAPDSPNLLFKNSSFELPLKGGQIPDWAPVWSREAEAATGDVDTTIFHSGSRSYRVTSTGQQDWSFANVNQIVLPPNAIVKISAWVKSQSTTDAEIGVVEQSTDGQSIDWMADRADCGGTHDWILVHHTFAPAPDAHAIQFRLTGSGPGTVWIDDVSLSITQTIVKVKPTLPLFHLTNPSLSITIDPSLGGALTVSETKSQNSWQQTPSSSMAVVDGKKVNSSTVTLTLMNREDQDTYIAEIHINQKSNSVDVNITGDPTNDLDNGMDYPSAFKTSPGDALVIPTNEGLLYPVDDAAVLDTNYDLYQGHGGLCMAWYGQQSLSDGSGVMAIVRTPDDATLKMHRNDQRTAAVLSNQISWGPSKGKWAYDKSVQFIFFKSGGYVAQAKAYRQYAESIGLVKTLAQKRAANPNIDKLIGAADIWDWESNHAAEQAQAFKDAGMDRVLWANEESAGVIDKINALGFLSSRYDIYQDEYEPSAPAWDPKGDDWPNDLMLDKNGNRAVSWIDYQTGPDGKKIAYTADACCSIPGLARAERKIPIELAAKHYTCRFIDTITASPWRECYSPLHPTTRTVDKQTKMKILNFVSNTERLVTGSETGIDSAVPYEDYFEGMMSLAHYRLPDSGYKVGVYQTPTPDFLKFQIGVGYRIPLFELVYHDCMVDTWYWGDASNQEPEVWRQRDLWNVLYGTSPIYILDSSRWASQKDRLIQSYKDVSTADRAVGYAQMLTHVFLTPDHTVQQTRWSNGKVITVNFGDQPYKATQTVAPLGYEVTSEKGKP